MAGCKTFWVVTVAMIIIVLIVAALAFYIYREAKGFSKKGDELYTKSKTFLQQGTTLVNRANATLDKVEPAADLLRANLPVARKFIADIKGARPLKSAAADFIKSVPLAPTLRSGEAELHESQRDLKSLMKNLAGDAKENKHLQALAQKFL